MVFKFLQFINIFELKKIFFYFFYQEINYIFDIIL
jgi:hypothetical protein